MRGKSDKKPKHRLSELVSRKLELPLEVLEGLPELELHGNREAVVSHCAGILEYNDTTVRLAAQRLNIKFAGRGLLLTSMTEESVVVSGFIMSIEFSQT